MTEEKKYAAIIIEKNLERATQVANLLEKRRYAPAVFSTRESMIQELAGKTVPLVILGETEEGDSSFQLMQEVVKRSPMTSIILITDASEKEVEEKAEGYGILGHVGSAPENALFTLLDNFEKISGVLTGY